METRHWDEERGVTETLRRKETLADYRYFPDPDLVPVVHTPEQVEELRARLPELPRDARARLVASGVSAEQAATLVDNELVGWLDEAAAVDGVEAGTAANWLTGELLGTCAQAEVGVGDSGLSGAWIGELVGLVADGTLSNKLAKQVLQLGVDGRGDRTPSAIAEAEGLQQVSDEGELRAIVDQVIADNAGTVEAIRGGNDKAIGALVGQVMKATRGQADPRKTNELLRAAIDAG